VDEDVEPPAGFVAEGAAGPESAPGPFAGVALEGVVAGAAAVVSVAGPVAVAPLGLTGVVAEVVDGSDPVGTVDAGVDDPPQARSASGKSRCACFMAGIVPVEQAEATTSSRGPA